MLDVCLLGTGDDAIAIQVAYIPDGALQWKQVFWSTVEREHRCDKERMEL